MEIELEAESRQSRRRLTTQETGRILTDVYTNIDDITMQTNKESNK
jgi:hypothetical protein